MGRRGGDGRIGPGSLFAFGCGRSHCDQDAHRGEIFRSGAAGQKPIMPDAVETLRQDVGQETTDELARFKRHGLETARSFDPVVLVFEGDAGLVRRDQAPVGDGNR